MSLLARVLKPGIAAAIVLAATLTGVAQSKDLGIEGQVFEPIEEDFRLMMMRLLARHDWSENTKELEDSARSYTKNLPSYMLPSAAKTQTRWKDVGIVVTEDIYMPWVNWDTGSVFEPEQVLAVQAGTYLNPIAKLPSAGIERLFIFDATDVNQLAVAKELMYQKVPQLSFMTIAGDPGVLAEEMQRPVYHPTPTMLEKFNLKAVPALIGFGRGPHQGHMAITEFKVGQDTVKEVKSAWYGLPYQGYDPETLADVAPEGGLAVETKKFMSMSKDMPAVSLPVTAAPEIAQPSK